MWQGLLEIFHRMEVPGVVPGTLPQDDITLVSRAGKKPSYSTMRPIAVLSTIH